eukprot:9841940-Alexandrium_andersonii.AAC.1
MVPGQAQVARPEQAFEDLETWLPDEGRCCRMARAEVEEEGRGAAGAPGTNTNVGHVSEERPARVRSPGSRRAHQHAQLGNCRRCGRGQEDADDCQALGKAEAVDAKVGQGGVQGV